MSEYFDALCEAMTDLARVPNVVFIGQAVEYAGTAMSRSLERVPRDRKFELPVAEDMQMGMAIGMSLEGLIPVCIYPRFNFLLLAVNQLVLHMDKLPIYGGYRPKVIIRTAIASDNPLYPGPQHLGDFSDGLKAMLQTVSLQRLRSVADIHNYYMYAINLDGSSILVEDASLY